jgi:hypothetical protein
MHVLDRAVAVVGGERLVRGRPGVGWLVIEVVPVVVWAQITGAMSNEYFYLVAFLTLLGADEHSLSWLSLMVFCSGIGQAVVVLRRVPNDPQRRVVIDSLIGRSLWLGTVAWPLIGWWLGWSKGALLAGVYFFVLVSQLTHGCGSPSFNVWTQALVPIELRGVFYTLRHIASYLTVALVLFGVSCLIPHTEAKDPSQLPWLGTLLAGVTVISILGVYALTRAPKAPPEARLTAFAPIWPQVRANPTFVRMMVWWMLLNAGMAASLAYQPLLFLEVGADTRFMAHWQAMAAYPAMIVGIFAAGRSLPHVGGRSSLIAASVLMLVCDGSVLALTHGNMGWFLPVLLGLSGFAKGFWSVAWIARLMEITPAGDPRFSSLYYAAGSCGGLLLAAILPWLVPALESAHRAAPWWPSAIWCMVAIAALMRLMSIPLLLPHDPPRRVQPQQPLRAAA